MDKQQVDYLQQIEFFLLYNLVVEELGLLRRTKRITPAYTMTISEGTASISRLFRSFLTKVFPPPMQISKRPYCLEFTVTIDEPTRKLLQNIRDTEEFQSLRTPTVDEVGLLYTNPNGITFTLGKHYRYRYNNRRYEKSYNLIDLGIGKFCSAVRAALSWRKRFDEVVEKVTTDIVQTPEISKRNIAQEQLDAVLKTAMEIQ